MPNLIETYARSTGLKIDKPWIREDFYPLPFEGKYITLATGSGQGSKNYDFWQEVVHILTPHFISKNISIVLLGSKEDPNLNNVFDLRGKTTIQQSYYLLKNACLHLGNDSWTAHMAGYSKIPLVAVYGSTDAYVHGPHWKGDKTILIESHRNGRKPSFGQEQLKTVNLIDPFDIARAALKLLDFPNTVTNKTLFIGNIFNTNILELIPNEPLNPSFNPNVATAVRMDLEHNEQVLLQVLQSGRKVNIVTKRPISLEILKSFAQNIEAYNHEIAEDCPHDYLKQVQKLGFNKSFFTRVNNSEDLSRLRFLFFDVVTIQQFIDRTRDDFEKAVKDYVNNQDLTLDKLGNLDTLFFRTNKFVLSRGKIYPSLAHERLDQPIENNLPLGRVIDSPEFWHDSNHFMIFK